MRSNRHATVVAYLALVMSLSGTAYALTVDGGDIVNGSVTGRDIRSGSIPEGDLGFNAVAISDATISSYSSQIPVTITPSDGSTSIAGVKSVLKNGFDAMWGAGTFSVTNSGTKVARIQVRPYVDGTPHGDHFFTQTIQPGATDLGSPLFLCNESPGAHTVELRIEVLEGDGVTIEQVEWNVVPVAT